MQNSLNTVQPKSPLPQRSLPAAFVERGRAGPAPEPGGISVLEEFHIKPAQRPNYYIVLTEGIRHVDDLNQCHRVIINALEDKGGIRCTSLAWHMQKEKTLCSSKAISILSPV